MNVSAQELQILSLKFQQQAEERKKEIMQLCSTAKYLTWLKRFMQNHTEFQTNDWSLLTEDNPLEDRENIIKLGLLFMGVETYAEEQEGLYPTLCSYGNYYSIKHNDEYYQLGRITNHSTNAYYCKRVSVRQLENPIEFSEVEIYAKEQIQIIEKPAYQKKI